MKVLVACEESQRVTIELRKLGNEAYSCDYLTVLVIIRSGTSRKTLLYY
mgnify:CR=1 FL=1|jgi:hypothetical protein